MLKKQIILPTSGKLQVVGNKIVDTNGNQVILKGLNVADPQHLNDKYWERPGISAVTVANDAISYNAKVIRLPILPGRPKYPKDGWFNIRDKYYNEHLKPLVNEITNQGIYAIIDLHYVADYLELHDKVVEFWDYVAPKFKDNPFVMYELFNEPILPDNWNTWKDFAQPICDLIRLHAPDNLILVGGPYWSSHMSGAVDNPIEGTNIVYVGHIYSNQRPVKWDTNYKIHEVAPLFITEWGFEKDGTEGGDIEYGEQFSEWLRTNSLSWTAWNYDILWGPRMCYSNWLLRESPDGMGEFVVNLLRS